MQTEPSFYEIIELENGDVALKRSEKSDGSPLVEIRFSEESLYFLGKAKFEVAKIMIEAGLDLVADLAEDELNDAFTSAEPSPVIH